MATNVYYCRHETPDVFSSPVVTVERSTPATEIPHTRYMSPFLNTPVQASLFTTKTLRHMMQMYFISTNCFSQYLCKLFVVGDGAREVEFVSQESTEGVHQQCDWRNHPQRQHFIAIRFHSSASLSVNCVTPWKHTT